MKMEKTAESVVKHSGGKLVDMRTMSLKELMKNNHDLAEKSINLYYKNHQLKKGLIGMSIFIGGVIILGCVILIRKKKISKN